MKHTKIEIHKYRRFAIKKAKYNFIRKLTSDRQNKIVGFSDYLDALAITDHSVWERPGLLRSWLDKNIKALS